MWTQITDIWQYAPSIGSFVIAVLAVTAVPATMVLRTWLNNRPAHQRALNEKYDAETNRRVKEYEAETDRQLSLRELEIAQEKMRHEARFRRESLLALAQEEMRFAAIEAQPERAQPERDAFDEAA